MIQIQHKLQQSRLALYYHGDDPQLLNELFIIITNISLASSSNICEAYCEAIQLISWHVQPQLIMALAQRM
jgi:hypothetical protein